MLASREIRRAKVRFSLLAGAVGLLVFLILFQQALFGSLLLSFTGALENQSGTVLVYSDEARKNVAGSIVLPPQLAAVEGVEGVDAVGPLGQATLTMDAAGEQTDTSVFGFEPGLPGEPTRLVEGRLPETPTEAVASEEDAEDGFGLGDTLVSVSGGVELTVVGLTEQSRYSVSPTLFVTYEGYGALRRAANPDATAVLPSVLAVTPADGVSAQTLAERITAEVDGVEALTRTQAVDQSPGVSATRTSFQLILALALLVVALVTGFFFLIVTVQKLPSLVLLRAVGASTGYLVRAILVQIAVVVAGGLVVGVLLTYGAIAGASAGLPISIDVGTSVALVVAVLVLALVGSAFTVVRVARLDPAEVVSRQSLGGLS